MVPGSHRDTRNPRGPVDGFTVSAPIAGDMQVVAPAGSVYIADSGIWHSTATHNTTGKLRVAAVNRWTPWWCASGLKSWRTALITPSAGIRCVADLDSTRPNTRRSARRFNDSYCDHGAMSGWLTAAELQGMPAELQPLLEHRCIEYYTAPNGSNLIQRQILDRAEAANERNSWGFARIGEPDLAGANTHLSPVQVAKL